MPVANLGIGCSNTITAEYHISGNIYEVYLGDLATSATITVPYRWKTTAYMKNYLN